MQRVAKIIASYGQCTKAQAEVLIQEGRVKVNGEVITAVPTQVPIDSKIYVDDTLLKKPRPRVFIHYKKKMFLAKLSFEPDLKGRRNLFAVLQAMGVPSVVPIDTLDYSSEGIMLLTNDSMYKALLAKTAKDSWESLYKLKVLGEVTEKFITKSREKGLSYQGEKYPGINIRVEEQQGEKESSYTWLTITAPASVSHVAMKDHFKRHGIYVSRLMRLTYGPYSLDNVHAGDVHEVPIKVIEKNIIKDGEQLPTIKNLTEPGPKKRKLTRMETKLKNKGLLDPRSKERKQKDEKDEDEDDIAAEEDIMDDEDIDDEDDVEEVKPRKSFDRKSDKSDKKEAYQPRKPNTFDRSKPFKARFANTKPWEKNSSNRPSRDEHRERGDRDYERDRDRRGNGRDRRDDNRDRRDQRREDDNAGDDNVFEKRAPSRMRSDTNRSQFYREKKSGEGSSYRTKKSGEGGSYRDKKSGEGSSYRDKKSDQGSRDGYKGYSKKSSGGFKPKRSAPREDDD
jgi:23S rRNA pseudouridine2605 synthase